MNYLEAICTSARSRSDILGNCVRLRLRKQSVQVHYYQTRNIAAKEAWNPHASFFIILEDTTYHPHISFNNFLHFRYFVVLFILKYYVLKELIL